ncbi:tegument protein [Macropodid alphaherpesvirus 1]|uniref:Tegument protein n=1 Tax=Macropodid alphaherpesvirus 1 TaxID=137443 RepID=A0A109Z815_9ALPH|nr:tegument protein [Macropodid alphaherpesvirus 1]AMB17049.1 tegument protein [Macropodid alphaherpesvirus 1]
MAGLLEALCGWKPRSSEHYELLRTEAPPSGAEPRLQEALTAVNALLPAPITLEDALASLDDMRRLAKARTLAHTYRVCETNLNSLAKHKPGREAPGLDGAVSTHRTRLRRIADTCLATLLQLYVSVGSADGSIDTLVNQAIKSVAENEVVMEDVAIAEKALGLQPNTNRSLAPPETLQPTNSRLSLDLRTHQSLSPSPPWEPEKIVRPPVPPANDDILSDSSPCLIPMDRVASHRPQNNKHTALLA